MWLKSWPDREYYSCSLQSLVVSFLLSLVSTLLSSRTGGILSYLNSLTHRSSQFPPRNLCSLVMLSCLHCNRHSLMLASKHFEIKLQQNVLNRVRNVKYLGMLIDGGLNWKSHIKQLSLQLSKSSAVIHHLRNFVDTETLKLLYCSLICSRVQYGIILWGTATYTRQKEIVLRLNNIVWIMTWSRKFDHISILYKQLKLLKLEDIYKLELSKFMYQ